MSNLYSSSECFRRRSKRRRKSLFLLIVTMQEDTLKHERVGNVSFSHTSQIQVTGRQLRQYHDKKNNEVLHSNTDCTASKMTLKDRRLRETNDFYSKQVDIPFGEDEPFWESDGESISDPDANMHKCNESKSMKRSLSLEAQSCITVNKVVSNLIAMLQGVEVLCSLAIMYLYKDDFNIDPAMLGFILAALRIPWTVKPVWALLSDNFPLLGYRRKSYVILGSFMCVVSTLGIGIFGFLWMWSTTCLLFLYFTGSAVCQPFNTVISFIIDFLYPSYLFILLPVCNVIGEALVVEAGRRDPREDGAAKTVSTFFAFRKLSFAIMSYLSGILLDYIPKQYVFLIATIMPCSVLISSFFMEEPRVRIQPLKVQLRNLYEVVKKPILLNSTLFIFLMMCTPSAGAVMFYFMTNQLKFNSELLGRMALFQSIASLCGIMAYMWIFSRTCIRQLLLWSTVIVTPFCLLPWILVERWNLALGIPDSAFVVTDTVLMEFIDIFKNMSSPFTGEFQAMPILVLAAKLCPPGLESTIYSFILSSYNLGLGVGSLISAAITAVRQSINYSHISSGLGITAKNFSNLNWLIIICTITNLIPLGIIFLIPKEVPLIETKSISPIDYSPISPLIGSDEDSTSGKSNTIAIEI
ncbi:putative folate/biopterin transporter [Cardiosporidium cionae]|uniref:Folate/biopterin transporter n=1 Tax=Cardiosporidium cionae TaxID=476202 RepID=A0ABQ7J9N0_9APIC|nr:putative folate/biopterin transporter [Cardiosporidium cionae]|eukprot:KAF8820677.1 putative folate/biopterin transporter [Cardiosporidium cionae]